MHKIPQRLLPPFLLGYFATSVAQNEEAPPSLAPLRSLCDSVNRITARPEIRNYVFPILASGAAFAVITRLWQVSAYTMAISTGNSVLGPVVGLSGLVTASVGASEAMHWTRGDRKFLLFSENRFPILMQFSKLFDDRTLLSEEWRRLFFPSVVGILFYTLLGGRWSHLVPSNLLGPGAFSDRRFFRFLSPRVTRSREAQTALGEVSGCHSCGTRRGPFIADLTPPTEIIARHNFNKPQVYLPQCLPCGRRASEVVKAGRREIFRHRELRLHVAAPLRPCDLTGALIALVLLGGDLQGDHRGTAPDTVSQYRK